MKDLVRLWLELLDHASERGVTDDQYMGIADRFTAWMGRLCEPEDRTCYPGYPGYARTRRWREQRRG